MLGFAIDVGHRVGYVRYGGTVHTMINHGFGIVKKINGHGHIILEDGKVFGKDGYLRGDGYSKPYLIAASDLEQRLATDARRRERNAIARKLQELLRGQTNGYGDVCEVSDELKEELIQLVRSL